MTAEAWITGEAPNQKINFRLPTGPKGNQGDKGPKGDTGSQGLPGVNAVPADEAVGTYATTPGTATHTALTATIASEATAPNSPAAFNYFDVRKAFSGAAGYMYGNSWLAAANYSAQQYPIRLTTKMGLNSMANLATSGYRMQDTATIAVKSGAKSWTAGSKGVVVVGDLLNNLIEPDDAKNRAAALESMRALVALLSASSRVEQTAFTFSTSGEGLGWSNPASSQGYASGGTLAMPGGTEGVYADIPVTAATSYLLVHGVDGTTYRGGLITLKQGATTLATKDTDALVKTTPYNTNGLAPVVIRISGHTAGTVRLIHSQNGRTNVVTPVDALLPQSATPPLIVLVKPVATPNAATHNKPALLEYLRTVPDTVAAEFGKHVLVIDPAPGWNPATMLGDDNLHPVEAGQEHVANAVTAGIKAELMRRLTETVTGTKLV